MTNKELIKNYDFALDDLQQIEWHIRSLYQENPHDHLLNSYLEDVLGQLLLAEQHVRRQLKILTIHENN